MKEQPRFDGTEKDYKSEHCTKEQVTKDACSCLRRGSYKKDKKRILDGLSRVEGQVRGVRRMVEEERYCVDVIYQMAAARMALARLEMLLLEDHTRGCVSRAIRREDGGEDVIEELMQVIKGMLG